METLFCTACGTALLEGAAFCTACGASAAVPAPEPAAAPAPVAAPQPSSAEYVVAIIPTATLKSGFMNLKSRAYTLVLTDRRVVFAQLTSAMTKAAVMEARDAAKADGKGFMGQWGAQIKAGFTYSQRYVTMSPEQTLAETPGNFAIDHSAIRKVKFRTGSVGDSDTAGSPDTMTIVTDGQKYKFNVDGGLSQAKQAMREARLT